MEYTVRTIVDLIEKIKRKPKRFDSMLASTLNRGATMAKNKSIKEIIKEVTLQEPYVRKHMKVTKRASPSDLKAVISANERAVLLPRFRHVMSTGGYSVAVNTRGGFREIRNAWMARTRTSNRRAIYLSNKDAYRDAVLGLSEGEGPTPGKRARVARLKRLAKEKPYGMQALHSRSINQLFYSVRDSVKPEVKAFMKRDLLRRVRNENR